MKTKKADEMTADELRAALKAEQDKSDNLQKASERRDAEDAEDRKRAERTRADADAARAAAPTEDQWVKLEEEYSMTRDEIQKQWKLIRRANAPLEAELGTYKAKEAAGEAVRAAKAAVKAEDAQFPKFEAHIDEYLADVPLAEKADPDRLKKHMDRAVHFARGKARSTDKTYREDVDNTRDSGATQEEKDDAAQGFGTFEISGMPLTVENQKLVPDDFRKRHQHPEQKEGVRMNERARWKEGVPVKPR